MLTYLLAFVGTKSQHHTFLIQHVNFEFINILPKISQYYN